MLMPLLSFILRTRRGNDFGIAAGIKEIKREFDKWEFERLLCGEYDKEGAVVSINAGAGGTDAQDWVEILLRMYSRWADNNQMSLVINELSQGEEAGIKSVTLKLMENMHMIFTT